MAGRQDDPKENRRQPLEVPARDRRGLPSRALGLGLRCFTRRPHLKGVSASLVIKFLMAILARVSCLEPQSSLIFKAVISGFQSSTRQVNSNLSSY